MTVGGAKTRYFLLFLDLNPLRIEGRGWRAEGEGLPSLSFHSPFTFPFALLSLSSPSLFSVF